MGFTKHDFQEKYKGYSDMQLVAIVENGEDYLPEAMEAAAMEIARRGINDTKRNVIRHQIQTEQEAKDPRNQNAYKKGIKLGANLMKFVDAFNPFTSNAPRADVRVVNILLWLNWGYYLYSQFYYLKAVLLNQYGGPWDFQSLFLLFFPIILVPLLIFGLYRLMATAYYVLVFLLVSSALIVIGSYVSHQSMSSMEEFAGYFNYPVTDFFEYFTHFLVHTAALWFIVREKFRAPFNATVENVIVTALLTLFPVIYFFFFMFD